MTFLRRGAWGLVAGGIAIATLADERTTGPARQVDGRWILTADFHVHSFFGDGALPPWDLRREAERRGLDAIAITNHNQLATSRFGAWLAARSHGPLVLPGAEITAPRYHLAAVGITRDVDWRQPLPRVIDDVHAQAGAAIAAHLSAPSVGVYDNPDVLTKIDGLEGPRPLVDQDDDERTSRLGDFYARAARVHPAIANVGSSDFHFLAPLGAYRTYLLAAARTPSAVVEAIRQGRTVACDSRGLADGDGELLPLVRAECARAAAGAHAPGRWSRLATWVVCVGLAAIAFGAGTAREP